MPKSLNITCIVIFTKAVLEAKMIDSSKVQNSLHIPAEMQNKG
jgi:hypothetical protein